MNVAVSNSPRSCVISGDPEAVRQITSELERDGVFSRAVKVDVASHSPQMEQPAAILASELAGMATEAGRLPIWSTVLGGRAEGSEFGAAYWGRNLREPVRFADAVNGLLDAEISIFVELGPHPVLLHAIEQTAHGAGRSGNDCRLWSARGGRERGVSVRVWGDSGPKAIPCRGIAFCRTPVVSSRCHSILGSAKNIGRAPPIGAPRRRRAMRRRLRATTRR